MKQESTLSVQCFVKKEFEPDGTQDAKLVYISETRPAASAHPRVMHAHPDYVEIILICDGVSEYLIDDKKYYVQKGDLLIYNSGVVHDEVSAPNILLSTYCIAVAGLHLPGLRKNALIPDGICPIFESGELFSELRQIYELMFQNLSENRSGAEQFCHYLMQAIISKVFVLTKQTQASSVKYDTHALGCKIKAYIDTHYHEPITLQTIGEALHVNPYHISHVFKQVIGYSPMHYVLRRRIGEAQTLLITTKLSMSEIAEQVGYETQNAFQVQFTKNVGLSPRKFRTDYLVKSKSDLP